MFGDLHTFVETDGKVLFKANDVAKALGYNNYQQAIRTHCKGVLEISPPTLNQHGATVMQPTKFISESDIYRLVMRSKLPEAERFQDWVCEEVLPSIRQTGAYMTQQTIIQVMQQPESILSICKKLVELNEENKRLAPKAEYADQVLLSPTCYTMTQVAKSLSMTVQELQHCLHNLGIIYRSPSGPWMLYAPYLKQGYEAYRTKTGENLFGDVLWTNTYLVWTERGKEFITKSLSPTPLLERGA